MKGGDFFTLYMCFSKSYTDSTKIIIGPYLVGPGFDDSLFGREWSVGLVGWGGGIICYDKVCLGLHLVNILQIASARMQFFLSVILVPTNLVTAPNPTSSHGPIVPSCSPILHRFTLFFATPEALYSEPTIDSATLFIILLTTVSQVTAVAIVALNRYNCTNATIIIWRSVPCCMQRARWSEDQDLAATKFWSVKMFIRKVQSNQSFSDETQLNLLIFSLVPICSRGKTKGSGILCKMNCCFQTLLTFNGVASNKL